MTPPAAGPRRSPPARAPSPPTSRDAGAAADLPAADPDKLVPVADTGRDDVDQDLAWSRCRRLVHLEDLDGLAECCDPGHPHPVRRTLLACPSAFERWCPLRRHGGRSEFDAST